MSTCSDSEVMNLAKILLLPACIHAILGSEENVWLHAEL